MFKNTMRTKLIRKCDERMKGAMMSEVAYVPPKMPDSARYLVLMVVGFGIVIGGAVLVNCGIGAMSSSTMILAGVCTFVCGAMLIFAGATKIWKTKPLNNFILVMVGIAFLVIGMVLMSGEWQPALISILITLAGLSLIFGGAAMVMGNWKNYIKK